MDSIAVELVRSWANREGNVSSNREIREWIDKRKQTLRVSVEKIDFSYNGFWYYDGEPGYIRNRNNSFFQVAGYQEIEEDQIVAEQPIIIQDEIGYLGIICRMMDGCLNFLMQAKIEPGNINAIQLSPTLQATKSNLAQKHGGKSPEYWKYFVDSGRHTVLVDQLQSEQSSRFYRKRNRNIIILVEDEVPLKKSHRWMTLGQIKELMKVPNLVNMDTRTVLSCLRFYAGPETAEGLAGYFRDRALFSSVYREPDFSLIHRAWNYINDYRQFNGRITRLLPLKSLKGWKMTDTEIVCRTPYDFKVIYCRIEIEDREVRYWEQPLIQALGRAVFGIFTCVDGGVRKYLVRARHEIGCFDGMEIGPLVQLEPNNPRNRPDRLEKLFLQKLDSGENVVTDVLLSEEGGRFYHEENRNVIIEIPKDGAGDLPEGVFWMDYATVSEMIQFNNNVNIQLRNLISLIDLV